MNAGRGGGPQHLQCGESRVDRVGLAAALCLPTGTLDLDDGQSGTGQHASQADSVAAGAFDPTTTRGPGACSAIHTRASEKSRRSVRSSPVRVCSGVCRRR